MSASAPTVVFFEDAGVAGLFPLTLTRPAFELRSGALNLRERVQLCAGPRAVAACVRPALQPLLSATLPGLAGAALAAAGPAVWINGRLRASVETLRRMLTLPAAPSRALRVDGMVAMAWIDADASLALRPAAGPTPLLALLESLPPAEAITDVGLFSHPWEIVQANGRLLCDDFRTLRDGTPIAREIFGVRFEPGAGARALLARDAYGAAQQAILYPGVHVLEEENVRFGAGCQLKPGVVLDAQQGPILIGAGALLAPNVVVEGPAYIGPGCTINPGARLREGTSLGALCKVGGEVEESVVLDLSNKQHDGFLGHAALGSWVNLGADTNGSDLKNNYGTVKVDLGEGEIDSGLRFVGPTIGDHSKTGINTMLTTGAVIGVCCNVYGGGFPPRFVPSFRWGGPEGWVEHRLPAALGTARTVMGRRQAVWLPEHEALLADVHAATARQR
jgi:UDP-N-acetylglucosamine diphosphorylase/glucosamine-1-phosphate N-acetyltransferase